jgi:hypothetical protein
VIKVKYAIKHGDVTLSVKSHGPPIICAMVSGMVQACIYGLICMEQNYPEHVQLEGDIDGWTNADSEG